MIDCIQRLGKVIALPIGACVLVVGYVGFATLGVASLTVEYIVSGHTETTRSFGKTLLENTCVPLMKTFKDNCD